MSAQERCQDESAAASRPPTTTEARRRLRSRRATRTRAAARDGRTVWLGGVGVDFGFPGELTGGTLSIVEHPVLPGTLVPPHVHRAEDELSIVLEGRFGVWIGDEIFEARPGAYVYKPRTVPRAFWYATDEPARLIELSGPPLASSLCREPDRPLRASVSPEASSPRPTWAKRA